MRSDVYDNIFAELCKMHPWMRKKVVHWQPNGNLRIMVELADGDVVEYDYILKTANIARSIDELEGRHRGDSEDKWRMEFARRLHRKLLTRGISQDELSLRTGISAGAISKYANGKSTPSTYNLKKIVCVIGCTIADLVDF